MQQLVVSVLTHMQAIKKKIMMNENKRQNLLSRKMRENIKFLHVILVPSSSKNNEQMHKHRN